MVPEPYSGKNDARDHYHQDTRLIQKGNRHGAIPPLPDLLRERTPATPALL
jgi:hypothetical protein